MPDIPYSNASSGAKAREEITALLVRIGCDEIGFMDKFSSGEVLLAFKHHGRPVQLSASAKGWAAWYLRENPWSTRRKGTSDQWKAKALQQGMIAVNSILRDWAKGQVIAIECGLFPAEAAFFAHMMAGDGRPLIAHVADMKLLAKPEGAREGCAHGCDLPF